MSYLMKLLNTYYFNQVQLFISCILFNNATLSLKLLADWFFLLIQDLVLLSNQYKPMDESQLISTCITIMLTTAFICFITSELTRNYSQVDKLWSLMPIVYSIVTLIKYPSPRVWLMFLLVATWGLRLSYNFYRKGGYNIIPWKGEEDYRWKIMRGHPILKGRFRFGLFNLLFISLYQNLLILMFSSPLLMAARYKESGLKFLDIIAATLMVMFIALESIADNQLFRFHKIKQHPGNYPNFYKKSIREGFLSEGLWSYVRHPNFISEQGIWISFYLFGVASSGRWFNWTVIGPFLLVLLFRGSTTLTESISSKKYPAYSEYKKDVSEFIPHLFRSLNKK
jgi:steroid 5-alpha reductase family enzyme